MVLIPAVMEGEGEQLKTRKAVNLTRKSHA
jgi:hypothetical protein